MTITLADLDIFNLEELKELNAFMQADADAFNQLDDNRFVTELDGQWTAVIGEDNFYFDTEAEANERINQY